VAGVAAAVCGRPFLRRVGVAKTAVSRNMKRLIVAVMLSLLAFGGAALSIASPAIAKGDKADTGPKAATVAVRNCVADPARVPNAVLAITDTPTGHSELTNLAGAPAVHIGGALGADTVAYAKLGDAVRGFNKGQTRRQIPAPCITNPLSEIPIAPRSMPQAGTSWLPFDLPIPEPPAPEPPPLPPPGPNTGTLTVDWALWERIHNCEQPGDWYAYGYFGNGMRGGGGLGISDGAWRIAVNNAPKYGIELPGFVLNATPEQQMIAAEVLRATIGWSWGCR
jgi:hypothetical protein